MPRPPSAHAPQDDEITVLMQLADHKDTYLVSPPPSSSPSFPPPPFPSASRGAEHRPPPTPSQGYCEGVVGRFEGGVGTFYGDDTHDGKDIRARFVWSGISATSARWEQAFSVDDGRTWLTNWSMEFTRACGTPAG